MDLSCPPDTLGNLLQVTPCHVSHPLPLLPIYILIRLHALTFIFLPLKLFSLVFFFKNFPRFVFDHKFSE